jgi:DamX protein
MAEERAENERTFLGLTHNPFLEPQQGFFERGGRKTHLEQLRHLSEWSRRVLLVTGSEGVGKTTLYRELAATLEPRVKAARINGSLVNTGFEVLSATAQGFGLAIPPAANTQSLCMDLIRHVEEQTASDRLCLALVDDAHQLDNRALESLITLARESGLHLVFFGEVRMVPTIERAASAKGVGWQEIRLTGYGEADARDYLEWRFSQAKYRGRIPFTDNEVKDLVKLSEGLPGRINQMANVLLVKLETGEGATARGGFPRVHAALLTLLVVAVGLLYLVAGETGSESADSIEGAAELAATDEYLEAPEQVEPVDLFESVSATAAEMRLEAGEPLDADEVIWTDDQSAGVSVDLPPSTDPLEADVDDDSEADSAAEVAEKDAPENDGMGAGVPAAEFAQVDSAVGLTGALEADEPLVNADERPIVAVAGEAPPTSVTDIPSTQAPVVSLPQGAKDTTWLLEQDPDYFTLQLVTVSSPDSASAFVARQQIPGDFTVYQVQREGRVLHVVLYGLFSSRNAAEVAADSLPAEVGQVQPWIRPVGQVQAAARLSTLQ